MGLSTYVTKMPGNSSPLVSINLVRTSHEFLLSAGAGATPKSLLIHFPTYKLSFYLFIFRWNSYTSLRYLKSRIRREISLPSPGLWPTTLRSRPLSQKTSGSQCRVFNRETISIDHDLYVIGICFDKHSPSLLALSRQSTDSFFLSSRHSFCYVATIFTH